ncbi:hypothetical protein NDU88_005208 [Pleurodeles waltl]|uniref:L1 transposable element RRM domain-containing protein n=1 Tax=Pleurodeles waltl TaxID=8319 RepID=A0AAV7WXV9_PLEWA|nr:hypothetical protein NDU88_005208 [Pleurodeles waltl]
MSERLDKQTERVDQVEKRVSSVEDGQTALASGQLKANTELDILKHKMDDLESRSRRNNLRIVGLAESTSNVNMEKIVESLLIQLLGQDTFSAFFVVEQAHRSLAARPPSGVPPRPVIARLLNYRDRDAALKRARELKTLRYEGMTLSLYPDFTLQVQEVRKQFLPGKKQLRDLQLDYRMLYPAKLRVDVEGNTIFFTDHKKLEQFVNRKLADKRNTPSTEPMNV